MNELPYSQELFIEENIWEAKYMTNYQKTQNK